MGDTPSTPAYGFGSALGLEANGAGEGVMIGLEVNGHG